MSYLSSTLDWNTFPVPALAEKDRDDLTACAENILLAREAHSPATIAEIHDPEKMPDNLRATHERNDEALGVSISVVSSRTTRSGWKSCSFSTRK